MQALHFASTKTNPDPKPAPTTLPITVVTVAEHGTGTGYLIGIFEERSMAVEVALAHGAHRLQRCCTQDAATSGAVKADLTAYILSIDTTGDTTEVFIRHQASGEPDDLTWCVRGFEIVRTPP